MDDNLEVAYKLKGATEVLIANKILENFDVAYVVSERLIYATEYINFLKERIKALEKSNV